MMKVRQMVPRLKEYIPLLNGAVDDVAACASIEKQNYPKNLLEGEAMFVKHAVESHCAVVEIDSKVVGYVLSMVAQFNQCPIALVTDEGLNEPNVSSNLTLGETIPRSRSTLAQLIQNGPVLVDEQKQVVYLHDMCVLEEFRGKRENGQKVSTLLFDAIKSFLQQSNTDTIILTAVHGAQRYWKFKGFQHMPHANLNTGAIERLNAFPIDSQPHFMYKTFLQ